MSYTASTLLATYYLLTYVRTNFSWQPIPPSVDYVPLGMVATRTEEPPSIKMVHCVPRNWVDPAPTEVKMLWSDSGNSGKPGSIWAVGHLQLLGAALGNEPPSHISWRLKRDRFTLADSDMLVPCAPPPPPGEPQSYRVGLQLETSGSPGAPPPPSSARTSVQVPSSSLAGPKFNDFRPGRGNSSGPPQSIRRDEPPRISGVPIHGGSPPKPPPPIAENKPVVTRPWTVGE